MDLSTILLTIVICLVLFWIRWRIWKMNIFQRYGIPGPKANFITGNLSEFIKKKNKCFAEWREKYGNIFGFFLGGKPCIACFDTELIKLLQIKEFKIFSNRDVLLPDAGISHKLVNHALPLAKDKNWKNMRSILTFCFSSAKIKKMCNLISDSIQTFMEKIQKQKLKPFDIADFYKKLTFDIICRITFGIKTNVQNEETNKFVNSVHKIFTVDFDILVTLSICFPEFEPIPTYIRRIKDVIIDTMNYPSFKFVFESIQKFVSTRKETRYHSSDILQIMIEAEDDTNPIKSLTEKQIIANAVTFLAAGYDTSSSALSFCSYRLAQNPEIQEKVRLEINENVKNNKSIEYADLMNFKYLDYVISETLRLHPVSALTVNRICSEDFKYKDITIPRGTTIIFPLPSLHTNESFWQEPEKFNPDRFLHKNEVTNDSLIYQPFGAGPRSCIGVRLAQTVMKLTLANLIRYFKIELHGNSDIEEDNSLFVIHPKNGVNIKVFPITS
ncbi:cytochrome P450 3A14-like [Centruroides sculpturatus]|uniref:cytochrome P450 3A14-like n=1 Tax=Centruroides sculpturatus TaxID=218467 RepID=UPI000C6DB0BE|nr:cytochrome P450 3A14-like [Centruroides sculpturatus]